MKNTTIRFRDALTTTYKGPPHVPRAPSYVHCFDSPTLLSYDMVRFVFSSRPVRRG